MDNTEQPATTSQVQPTVKPCPFCGSNPRFEGDPAEWQDESRYVQMTLTCCATMTETIWWRRARDMTVTARGEELRAKLTTAWNKRV